MYMTTFRSLHNVRNSMISAVAGLVVILLSVTVMAGERPDSFADQAEKLSPAVVNISTTTIVSQGPSNDMPQFPPGSPFEEFFKNFGDNDRKRRASSLGSGFIIDKKGIVVTNYHVIENAEEITVVLSDDQSFKAKVLGQDQKTDIAVLQIDPDGIDLTAVEFGDSDKLRVGDWVLAIGNPFGLGGTVTAGIVSARGRDIGNGPYDDFIQTDASINRGNSGGPLFNLNGEVIGINTAIFSQSGGSVGIGFAISSNLAKRVTTQLEEFGTTRRGWLGVFIQEVTPDIADSLGLETAEGALVSSVNESSPADAAGIEPGDVIVSFDGKRIERMRDLPRIVAETDIGAKVAVELFREGKSMSVSVELGELEKAELVGMAETNADKKTFGSLGFSVENMTVDLAQELGLDAELTGVVVTEVISGSPAADKGLEPGDMIRRFGQRRVETASAVAEAVGKAKESGRSGILILVEREGNQRFVQIGFGED